MKYKVKSPLLHNGKFYNEGDEIELIEEEAKDLQVVEKIEESKQEGIKGENRNETKAKKEGKK